MEKILNVAVIGCGIISKRHMKAVHEKEGCVLYAICDNAEDDRMKKKRQHNSRTAFFGTKGTIIFENKSTEITLFETEEDGTGYKIPKYIPCTPKGHNMDEEVSDFVDAIREGRPTPITSLEGLHTVTACCATVEAAKTEQTVKIQYPVID